MKKEFKNWCEENIFSNWIFNGEVFEGYINEVKPLELISDEEFCVKYNGSVGILEYM